MVCDAVTANRRIGPVHDPVSWYKITHAGEQVAQWDFQSKATRTSPPGPAFVLEVPLRYFLTSMYSISYRGPVLWNHLPTECRNANSVKSFSRMINKLTLVRDIDFSNLFSRR